MAWVRVHDGALSHPKIVGIFDPKHPFCLWMWGLSYCQMHLTDGVIPREALTFRTGKAIQILVDRGLWETTVSGYQVHDYLEWNDAKEVIVRKRTDAKERMSNARQRTPSREVLRGVGNTSSALVENEKWITSDDTGERARGLLERYAELFYQHCQGARYHARPALHFPKACELVTTWTDDARLEKLAVLVLTTDDDWISKTDRGFDVFAAKASWADQRLTAWERERAS